MTNEELKNEYLELIRYYQQIIYNYKNYSNYESYECTWQEAESRLEYYTKKYEELVK